VIINKFTKWGYFIPYSKSMTSEELSRIYIKKVFVRHRVLTKIISNRDRKFILEFWETFIAEQGIQVAISTVYYL
jgi:hypothetical protein